MKELIEIVKRLRSPDGCPWDRKQTHRSLIPYLLEETWEVIEEIEHDRTGIALKEELGDLLLQIVLHAQIAAEAERFTFDAVVDTICRKMINRHPHVFESGQRHLTEQGLKDQWQRLKSGEKKTDSVLEGVPSGAPALLSANIISRKAAAMGFDWKTPWDVLSKVEEELDEVRQEMVEARTEGIEAEIGDLLFSIVNLARKYRIDPEIALKKGNEKFKRRFRRLEKFITEARQKGCELTAEEMEHYWEQAKRDNPDPSRTP
jgi:tetrapyrrole methylase family protein / MazG family protein